MSYISFRQQSPRVDQIGGAIEEVAKGFVIHTISLIRKSVMEEEWVVEKLLETLKERVQVYEDKSGDEKSGVAKSKMEKLQNSIDELNKESDYLSEKLFELSQSLIQQRLQESQHLRLQIQKQYIKKIIDLEKTQEEEKCRLKAEIQQLKIRCENLEGYIKNKQEWAKEQIQKTQQIRRQQLNRYLDVIDQVYEQIQILKHSQSYKSSTVVLTDSRQTEHINRENYSQNYYPQLKMSSSKTHLKEYYAPHHQENPFQINNGSNRETQRNLLVYRMNHQGVNHKNREYHYHHRQTLEEGERVKQDDKWYRQKSQSSEKGHQQITKPLMINSSGTGASKAIRSDKFSNYQSYQSGSNLRQSSRYKRQMEQKNKRMSSVESKLQGLKKKLERELKAMKE